MKYKTELHQLVGTLFETVSRLDPKALMELSERLEQAHIESQGLLKLMDKGNLSDFYRLKPISGLTLLATCAAIDDRTLLVLDQNSFDLLS